MRTLSIIAIIITTIALAWSADVQLPREAQAALDKFDTAKAKIDAEAAKATAKEQDKLIADLQKVLDAEMKKKNVNLEVAVALKAKIDGLEALRGDLTDLLGNPLPEKSILGKWRVTKPDGHNAIWTFKADKTMDVTFNDGRVVPGTWSVKENAIRVDYPSAPTAWETINFPINDNCTGDGWNIPAGTLKATRTK